MAGSTQARSNKRAASEEADTSNKVRKTKAKAPRYGKRIITVKVGENDEQQSFDVFQDLLTKHSDFFKAALTRGEWTGRKNRIITLPEQKPEIFEFFQQFIFTGSIYSADGDTTPTDEDKPNDQEYPTLAACWHIGDVLQSTSFRDATVDAVISRIRTEGLVPIDLHRSVYAGPYSRSGMRELVVDVAVWSWRHENLLKREEGAFSKDFLHDVAITLHKLRREDIGGWEDAPFSSGSTCIYHDHVAESEPCFKTMF